MNEDLLVDPNLGLGPDMDLTMHAGHSPEGLPSATPSEHLQPIEDDEDTEISEDISKELVRSGGRNSALVKRKTTAMIERMAAKEAQQMPTLAQGVEQLLNLDIQQLKKRGRGEGSDSAADAEGGGRRQRRPKNDDFNAASLIGSIFMRVQGTKAPAPLVYFDDDINNPQWFKESIDGVQPVLGFDDFDPEQVNLESMGKLVDGNVLPATLGEVAAYFTHVLGDPRTNKEIAPRVLIAIQCDRAKGWFTYKRDNDNNNFVPVVLCAAENGRGLEEVSPAHFEVHRAQCAQKKWRQSFKVLGAQKLHKVTSLAQAALGDVLRHLERILGAERPMQLRSVDANNANSLGPVTRVVSAANHPTFRQPGTSDQAVVDDGMVRTTVVPREMVAPRVSAAIDQGPTLVERIPTQDQEAVRRMLSTNANVRIVHEPAVAPLPPRMAHVTGVSPGRPAMLPGARPATAAAAVAAGGSRLVVGGKPILRRHTDDPNAAVRLAADPSRGLDLLATAASTAITSPRAGGVGPTGVQAGLLAAALSGVSFNELLQLVIDNTTRRQQHAQQAQLLQQLAALQASQVATEKLQAAASIEQAAKSNGATAAGPSATAGAAPAVVPPPALSRAECEAISVIVKNVRGLDVAHAVRGILQHVAMQHVAELPTGEETVPALAEAVQNAAEAEGLVGGLDGNGHGPDMVPLDADGLEQAAEAGAETIEVDMEDTVKID